MTPAERNIQRSSIELKTAFSAFRGNVGEDAIEIDNDGSVRFAASFLVFEPVHRLVRTAGAATQSGEKV